MNLETLNLEDLSKLIVLANGKRRLRKLDPISDAEKFIKLVKENTNLSVQIRAEAVSNSYGYLAPSTYIRYNYKTKNIQVGSKTFAVPGGDNGNISIKKYDYGF